MGASLRHVREEYQLAALSQDVDAMRIIRAVEP